jgi:uncharacterized protein YbjT (DUF2867 family)
MSGTQQGGRRIIAVIGATGQQGGGLARAVLDDPEQPFALRALTRDPSSQAARELAARGAEVVAADLGDEAAVREAFDGAYGAFVVTNFWAPMTPEEEAVTNRARREFEQAAVAARAARDAGLRHVVWSTLDDTRPHFERTGADVPLLMGGYPVPHFDVKAEADELFRKAGVPTTFLRTTMYYESLAAAFKPARDESGNLVLSLPMADRTLAAVGAEDIGRTAYGIFREGTSLAGETVALAGAHATGEEIAALESAALGEKVVYRPTPWDEFRSYPFPGAVETANMFQFYAEADETFVGDRDLERVRRLNPQLESLEAWIAAHKDDLR